MPLTHRKLDTPYGAIAVADSGGEGMPLILLHGSGAWGAVFSHQFESPLVDHFRMIALDLPGHGASDNFAEPDLSYTLPEMARVIGGLFSPLGIERAGLFGWSLGGHIAIEMMAQMPDRLAGVMIAGTPPIDTSPLTPLRAFHLNPTILLVSKPNLSHADAERIVRMSYGDGGEQAHVDMLLRSDPQMRQRMTRSIVRGEGANQKHVVMTSPVPLAVVHGSDDPAVRGSYLSALDYANLWERKVHMIQEGSHAPFLGAPNRFNALLHRFATDASVSGPRLDMGALARKA